MALFLNIFIKILSIPEYQKNGRGNHVVCTLKYEVQKIWTASCLRISFSSYFSTEDKNGSNPWTKHVCTLMWLWIVRFHNFFLKSMALWIISSMSVRLKILGKLGLSKAYTNFKKAPINCLQSHEKVKRISIPWVSQPNQWHIMKSSAWGSTEI